MIWHLWLDSYVHVQLGSAAHIAPNEPMTSINQQGSNLGLCPTLPSHNPHYNPTLGFFDLVSSSVYNLFYNSGGVKKKQ